MAARRYTGSAIRIDFENTYEYHGHMYDGAEDFLGTLNYDLNMARDIHLYKKDVEKTLEFAVELAKEFVDNSHPVNPYTAYEATHKLSDSIKYDTSTSSGGTGGRLYADAQDKKGHRYAGHIEYGFTDRAGIPRGPWPFLRPAMRLALSATRADFADTMSNVISGNFNQGYMTIGSKNARSQVNALFGNTRNATDMIRRSFQDYSDTQNKGSYGRWAIAENGIGFKSGISWGFTADDESWSEGRL